MILLSPVLSLMLFQEHFISTAAYFLMEMLNSQNYVIKNDIGKVFFVVIVVAL